MKQTTSVNLIWQILGLYMKGRNFDSSGYLATQGLASASLSSYRDQNIYTPSKNLNFEEKHNLKIKWEVITPEKNLVGLLCTSIGVDLIF